MGPTRPEEYVLDPITPFHHAKLRLLEEFSGFWREATGGTSSQSVSTKRLPSGSSHGEARVGRRVKLGSSSASLNTVESI